MDNSITLKSIYDLVTEKFIIPSYQRGYRWSESQVTDLLNDILDFYKEKSNEEFYCLQPLMVTKKEGETEWEVIDGQQRITTVYLILNYFNLRLLPEHREPIYSINYKTRTKSIEFLQNPNEDLQNDNIDFYHIYKASEVIKNWFSDKINRINDFKATLLNRTKFIWFEAEIKDDTEAINIFTRINIGKIPLTNGELIKALFLNRGNFADNRVTLNQIQIASEWDRIEYKLQDNSFWDFIYSGKENYPTRIEYIFDLLINKKPSDSDTHFTFIKYKELFDKDKNIESKWNKVKADFMTFEEWFNDDDLYHLIGFLIADNYSLAPLKDSAMKLRKLDFKKHIQSIISTRINSSATDIEEYEYPSDRNKIRQLLLLFNIQSIVSNENSNIRFPFDKFKEESWDIEHVRAVKSDKPVKFSEQISWLKTVYELNKDNIGNSDILSELNKETERLLKVDKWASEKEFDKIYEEWLLFFNKTEEPEYINSIGNLTLLDAETNRSYKNAVFPIKRNIIIERDKSAIFVPICTKNVFLKYYSPTTNNMMYWSDDDKSYYLNSIKLTLKEYLKPEPTTHGTKS